MSSREAEATRPKLSGERLNKMLAVAGIVGSLILSVAKPAGSSAEAYYLQGAGITTGEGWSEDPEVADATAKAVVNLHGNTLEFRMPYTQGGDDISNDAQELCGIVNAGLDHGLTLVERDQGYTRKGELGFVPSSATELRQYYTAKMNEIFVLKKCAPELEELYIAFANEPDSETFSTGQYVKGRYVAAEKAVNLYSYMSRLLRKEAAERGISVKTVFGELNQRDSVHFVEETKKIMAARNISATALADVVSIHYWFNGPDAVGSGAPNTYLDKITSELNSAFPGVEKWVSETAAITEVPQSLKNDYDPVRGNLKTMTPAQQGQAISWILSEAAKRGYTRVMNFQLQDDGTYKSTGLINKDGTKKSSYYVIKQQISRLTSD